MNLNSNENNELDSINIELKDLEEMEDELIWTEYQLLQLDEPIKLQETKTGTRVRQLPVWLNIDLSKEDRDRLYKDYIHDYLDLDNPYRKDSSVSLSLQKNNYRWIETELLKTLMKSGLTGSEWSVLFYIIHRTRGYCNKNGFYKHIEDITKDEIQEYTDLSRPTIYKILKSLKNMKIIYEVKRDYSNKIGVNFRYDTWDIN